MIEPLRRGGILLIVFQYVHGIIAVVVIVADNGAHLYFSRERIFYVSARKIFLPKACDIFKLAIEIVYSIIFFLQSYQGRCKIMTLLFIIHKNLAEIFKFLRACVSHLHEGRNSSTYL